MAGTTTLRVCPACENLFVLLHWRTEYCPDCSEDEAPEFVQPEGMVACVYHISNVIQETVYVGMSKTVKRRLRDHQKKNWWFDIDIITCEWFPTLEEAKWAERRAINDYDPIYNKQHSRSNNVTRVCSCGARFYPYSDKQDYCSSCWRGMKRR